MASQWDDLAKLADVKFQLAASKIQQLRKAQGELAVRKQRLRDINEEAVTAMREPHEILAHNGDVAWQTWVGRNRRDLSIEEAQLRALYEIQMPSVAQAFGRKTVLEAMARLES